MKTRKRVQTILKTIINKRSMLMLMMMMMMRPN